MRYLGSKVKLLPEIENLIEKYNIQGETFADLFAGTGCVGDYFKNRYSILANDFLYYSYVLNKAKLQNSNIPRFSNFKRFYNTPIFEWLNSLQFTPDETYFIYNNYTEHGGRQFFSENNGIKIDGIRQTIEDLYNREIINENEYYFLLASLIESVTRYSNTSGTYEAFFKFLDPRTEKEFELSPLEMNITKEIHTNTITSENTNFLIRHITGDIAYIDTPYTVTQYVSAYHLLETLAKYDNPEIKGVGGKRDRENKNSLYARKSTALIEFEDLFRQLNFKHIIISYSNQGLVKIDELLDLAKKFAKKGKVNIEYIGYQEYQNHRSSNKRNGQKLTEVLIYFEKDIQINKSPLNYSGSKDTMFDLIQKELPKHVSTFVDVMGGAFNVGANIVALNSVIYNEINKEVFNIVKWLVEEDKEHIITYVNETIEDFGLKKADREAYNNLRTRYNDSKDFRDLFVLHMYSFQNMIRFNGTQQFNTPIGVAGYSKDLEHRIKNFKPKTTNCSFINNDYTKLDYSKFPEDTVFYFDPPYIITSAAYNDGKRGGKGWTENEEIELLTILKKIDSLGFKFLLSNVVEHHGKKHEILINWVKKNNFKMVDAGISGWRYAKHEVLIKNF